MFRCKFINMLKGKSWKSHGNSSTLVVFSCWLVREYFPRKLNINNNCRFQLFSPVICMFKAMFMNFLRNFEFSTRLKLIKKLVKRRRGKKGFRVSRPSYKCALRIDYCCREFYCSFPLFAFKYTFNLRPVQAQRERSKVVMTLAWFLKSLSLEVTVEVHGKVDWQRNWKKLILRNSRFPDFLDFLDFLKIFLIFLIV